MTAPFYCELESGDEDINVNLTPELENLVNQKVSSGLYNSADEVVREALRLMQQRDELRRIQQDELRKKIQKRVDALRAGKFTEYETADDIVNDIEKIGKAPLAKKRNGKKR